VPETRAAPAAAFLERGAEIGPRTLQRGDEAEQNARHGRGQNGEGQNAPIQADQRAFLTHTRQVGCVHTEERANSHDAENAARGRARQGQQDAFGEELADDASASGADGDADGDLPAACHGAGQQQVGDVGAGDQQHETDRAHQTQKRGAHIADHGFTERIDAEAGIGT
jgi:hypothetical protein